MTKHQYNAIAEGFKHQTSVKQYHYAMSGFNKETGHHTTEGIALYNYLTALSSLAFTTANALADGNDNFDRDTFLRKAGMMEGRGGYGGWSFLPNKEYIDRMNLRG